METNPFRAQRQQKRAPEGPSAQPTAQPTDAGPSSVPSHVGVRVRTWVERRVAGQVWYYRAPLLLIMAWILKNHLSDPMYNSIFAGVNLGFHEAGHAAFMWFGSRFWAVAGGTIFEIGIPVAAGLYLLVRQRDPFGASVCVFWLGTALVGAGIYAADAMVQVLPLVSPFGPVDPGSHDWTFMLMKFGKLTRAEIIGGAMQTAGKATMAAALVPGGWILLIMAKANPNVPGGGASRATDPSAGVTG